MNKLETLAKGRYGKVLVEVLEALCNEVADVRTNMKVKPEIENAVRLGVIQIISERLTDKLKVLMGDIQPPDIEEHV